MTSVSGLMFLSEASFLFISVFPLPFQVTSSSIRPPPSGRRVLHGAVEFPGLIGYKATGREVSKSQGSSGSCYSGEHALGMEPKQDPQDPPAKGVLTCVDGPMCETGGATE